MQSQEGGIVAEEYRTEYVVDRVNTFGRAFLGLSVECARCHDHKYDPITQKEFYRLYGFFNNVNEDGPDSLFGRAEPDGDPDDAGGRREAGGARRAHRAARGGARSGRPAFDAGFDALAGARRRRRARRGRAASGPDRPLPAR